MIIHVNGGYPPPEAGHIPHSLRVLPFHTISEHFKKLFIIAKGGYIGME
ncbi:hypothetical protein Calab_1266 [Caldithrix abyssi DSM 13497]|uniref:Uncharacterized protein n=1 Tax=Caldithrix abyssi DSM 13497 TaxID=880073 RepID=H1XY17_CALAY|nr:hypothetical protein Calab_1266 [Caldithrix abyssi DSM 13497]